MQKLPLSSTNTSRTYMHRCSGVSLTLQRRRQRRQRMLSLARSERSRGRNRDFETLEARRSLNLKRRVDRYWPGHACSARKNI
ncbi:unnamed protein product [Trichogramma brassicae]|uniref:Uncharacterized protein n=1 Tax=Trichogramma brassicae TaxID=86971 RepID=A0A6H5IEQ4_9HYME|nr:unnamed protein product [Trichogramma brassicae]